MFYNIRQLELIFHFLKNYQKDKKNNSDLSKEELE